MFLSKPSQFFLDQLSPMIDLSKNKKNKFISGQGYGMIFINECIIKSLNSN